VITAVTGLMTWRVLRETVQATTRITAMMMFILIFAQEFALSFRGLQGERLVHEFFEFLPGGIWADVWFLMLIIFVLGFFVEWI
jgi:TRAP-type mannitol/chloroaromatic compound transport system permease large subunit